MGGKDAQTQTKYRDGESQTSAFDLLLPQPWQAAAPDPWVLEGCPIGYPRKIHPTGQETLPSEHWFARPKEKEKNRLPFVFPTKLKKNGKFLFSDQNSPILEPFTSLSYKAIEELEPRVAFKLASCNAFPTSTTVICDGTAAGQNGSVKLSRGSYSNRRTTADSSGLASENSQIEKPNHRNFTAYLGRHRKILTPRCDPLLVVRMERANAVVLLQRCLRGRAAQVTMADTRARVLELYPELNQLEDCPNEPKPMNAKNELGAVKALVAERLFDLFTALQVTPSCSSDAVAAAQPV